MHSELFQIGPFTLRMYGFCMALGFLLAWRAMVLLRKKTRQPYEDVATLLTWVMISSILGARLAYVMLNWNAEFAHDPMAILRIDQGGLVYYGGLIGAMVMCVGYTLYYKVDFFDIGDVTAAVLPLGQFFGRLGCFMHGCCYGQQTDAWYGICFPRCSPAWGEQFKSGLIKHSAPEALAVIPTQLIESLSTLILFVILFRLYPRHYRNRGFIGGCYLLGYATLRFFIEFLRGDVQRGTLAGLSTSQTISILIFVAGVACLVWSKTKGRNASVEQVPLEAKELNS
jgi:phosphatidylglycerol---prolipoprotein diacylglyceryl transferase